MEAFSHTDVTDSVKTNESLRGRDLLDSLIEICYKKDILLTKDALEYILMNTSKGETILSILNKYESSIITRKNIEEEIESIKKELEERVKIIRASMYYEAKNYNVKIERIWELNTSYESKTTVQNFADYFNDRYNKIRSLLLQRNGVKNVMTIDALLNKKVRENEVMLIVMIRDKILYNNGFLKFIVEDQTGEIEAIPKDEIRQQAENIVEDDVLALKGKLNGNRKFIFDEILYPDVPFRGNDEIAKLDAPLTAAFISDLHFGSKKFLREIMDRFFKWLKSGDEWASKLKFLFILGDNVDGIGIYPEQPNELEIANIYDQYKAFEDFLLKIPEHINVVVIPGNHDAVRLAEPQPPLNEKLMPEAVKAENIFFETNPSLLGLSSGDNDLVKVLLYHGYSFNSIIDALAEIRKVARDKPAVVMRELLKRRHLAPIYGSTLIAPKHIDMHVIDIIPDIFASGDLHSHDVSNYKGTTLISSSTWQDQTAFQDRVGHVANPGKVTVVDLHTRHYKVYNFYEK